MQPEIQKLIYDIKAACALIIQFTDEETIHEYLKDALLRSGVERQFEIIGEALNQAIKIEPSVAEKLRNSRRIINFRNILIHGYSSISDEIVWCIVEKNLPYLIYWIQENRLMKIEMEVLDKIKSVILQKTKPNKIVLFGSAARDEMTSNSDVDLLIIVPEEIDKIKTAWAIYPLLTNLGIGVDLIIVHEKELNAKLDDKNLIYHSALKDGQEIYAA